MDTRDWWGVGHGHINPWAPVYAIGATFGGNFRLAVGSTLGDSFDAGNDNPVASASNVEAGFILSGKGLGPITFDLFYAINGKDNNTIARSSGGAWDNLFGVYAGLDLVKDLGLSVGYTAKIKISETQQRNIATGGADPVYKTYNITNPLWSGVDVNVKYSGIPKVGIGFNNNISFAGTKVEGIPNNYTDVIVGLTGTTSYVITAVPGVSQTRTLTENWFAYKASLSLSYSATDRLGIAFVLRNVLTSYDSLYEAKTTTSANTSTTTNTRKTTTDDLIASVHADYSVGNVTFGIGLTLGVKALTTEREDKSSTSAPSSSRLETTKGDGNIVHFGVPVFFRVAF